MKNSVFVLIAGLFVSSAANAAHFCAGEVLEPAKKLFALQYGPDDADSARYSEVAELPPIKSPNGKLNYSVLETTAEIGKMGTYRIRMIFAILGNGEPDSSCILMGQEILDMSSL